LSYAGQVRVGAISDRETVPHPESIVAGFQAEFDALLALALEKPATVTEWSVMLDDALVTIDKVLAADRREPQPTAQETLFRCRATTKSGRPCKNPPLDGSDYCYVHQ
jgi:hypothetical protein